MPSLETICTVCDLPVGLMNDYKGPTTLRGLRKASPHADPSKPKVNGRAARCAGSCLEVPDLMIYEVAGGQSERRRRRLQAAR